jgi:O-antigen ligase
MFGRPQELKALQWRYLLVLWPLVLLTPHLPGIPRPAVDGLPWRQELTLSLLLTVSLLIFILPRTWIGPSYERLKANSTSVGLLGLFVCWTLLSVAWASDHYQALHLATQWACYFTFFVLLLVVQAKTIRRSIPILMVVVWILIIASALETWLGAPITDGSLRVAVKPILRASGTFGELMGVCSVLLAGCSLAVRKVRQAVILGATSAGCWLATIQSIERAPFIATAIGLFVLLSTAALSRKQRRIRRVVLITIALFAVFVSQSLPSTASEEEELSTAGRLQQSLHEDSNTHARLLLWAVGFEMLKSHPLTGVGGGNYQVNYDDALAKFASAHPNSSLVQLNDHLLPFYAHNEYVQMFAELGVIGVLLFAGFVLTLVVQCFRRVRTGANRFTTIAAGAAILAFLLSSGASASSFRSVGCGLLFFFAAAIILRGKRDRIAREFGAEKQAQRFTRLLTAGTVAAFMFFAVQASGTVLLALAEQSGPLKAEQYYRSALRIYPASSSVNFSYGMWLYSKNRFQESVPRLEKAITAGLNSSICYEYLAAAQDAAGDITGAERTLGKAVKTYSRSVFLLNRHAVALDRLGRHAEAALEIERAMTIDPRACRGWQQLLVNDIDEAHAAALRDKGIARPNELRPYAAVFAVLRENEIRNPDLLQQGWRKRMSSASTGAATKVKSQANQVLQHSSTSDK